MIRNFLFGFRTLILNFNVIFWKDRCPLLARNLYEFKNGEGAFLILHVLIYVTRFPVQFQNHHSKLQRNLLENSRRCLLLLQNLYELQIGEEAFPIPSRNTSLTFLYWTISQYESQRSQSLATPITLSTPSQY